MSSQAGFVTKNGNLSARALKRIFKDGGVSKKPAVVLYGTSRGSGKTQT
jgi:hypothetical protein